MPQYQILRMDAAGTPPLLNGALPMTFDDPADAAHAAKVYSKARGEKLCVKPIVDEEWRKREIQRIQNKDYRPLPWVAQGWWQDAYTIWKDHYPHASLEKPGYIAYTKNEEDGAKDKQTIVRVGSYLNKYFEKHLSNYGMSQRGLVQQFMVLYGPIDVKFATTEEDIVQTYYRGPDTCLKRNYDTHPATVYAAGDLAIAYIGDIKGKVSARSLVWPEKKIHSRVYGDVARLTQGLARLGYAYGPPIGAKLKRIELESPEYKNGQLPEGCFVAPYIDRQNKQGGGHLAVIDKGDHLIICEDEKPGSHHCGLADGTTGLYVPREDEHPRFICENCEQETLQVNEVVVGTDDAGEPDTFQQWCKNCRRGTWECRYSGKRCMADIERTKVDGNYWLTYYASMYGVRCEGSGKLCYQDRILKVTMPDGTLKKLSGEYCEATFGGTFTSELTNRVFTRPERTYLWTGLGARNTCAKQELKRHAFQCDGCDAYWQVGQRHQPKDDILLCPVCTINLKDTKELKLSARSENERAQQNLPLTEYQQQAVA